MIFYKAFEALNFIGPEGVELGLVYNQHARILEDFMKLYRQLIKPNKKDIVAFLRIIPLTIIL